MKKLFRSMFALIVMLAALMAVIPAALAGGPPPDRYPNVWTRLEARQIIWNRTGRGYLIGAELPRSANNGKYYIRSGESFIVKLIVSNEKDLSGLKTAFRVNLDCANGVLKDGPRRRQADNVYTAGKPGFIFLSGTIYSLETGEDKEFQRGTEDRIIVRDGPVPNFSLNLGFIPDEAQSATGTMVSDIKSNVPLTGVSISSYQYGSLMNVILFSDQGTASYQRPMLEFDGHMITWQYIPGSTTSTAWIRNSEGATIRTTTVLGDGIMNGGVNLSTTIPPTTEKSGTRLSWRITPALKG